MSIIPTAIPGAFPGPIASPESRHPNELMLHASTISKQYQSAARNHLLSQFDLLATFYICLIFLYDYNILLLVVRLVLQSFLSLAVDTPMNTIIPPLAVYQATVFVNVGSLIIHGVYGQAVSSRADGYIFGHYIIQVIGQQQLSSRYPLLLLDFVLITLNMALFDMNFGLKVMKEHRLGEIRSEGPDGNAQSVVTVNLSGVFKGKFLQRLIHYSEEMAELDEVDRIAAITQLYGAV
ncbi:hypothetical protein BABINDRAFT_161485 [Babjeviella inositovora NRRL Y-12698]|uniref:DUF1746 domain-containing protein n=1 Tax=Babjeviella inositovora NRRL Y-12698 TaxID=984486 RepID=A0A1E3QQ52_9ASCO|nr:uncharacterized protein BABINDRAFT_161485 [Babjeviella inositovora NRRL Y-12698]ODQ79791.1 hypothetical protein BABINDRAFT_161485 [Babjeviella inositovora NRRL Y-12698]